MTKQSTSKEKICAAFRHLCNTVSFNKITVSLITREAGVHRNTFYYYFHDIPDLLGAITEQDLSEIISGRVHYQSLVDCIRPFEAYASAHSRAILNIWHSSQREALEDAIDRLCAWIIQTFMDEKGRALQEKEKEAVSRYYISLLFGVMMEWLRRDLKFPIGEDFELLKKKLPQMDRILLQTD